MLRRTKSAWNQVFARKNFLSKKLSSARRRRLFFEGLEIRAVLTASAQVGTDVFLQGGFIEVGVNGGGSYGSQNAAPVGFHPAGGRTNVGLWIDSDGIGTGAGPVTGDYFLPGTPEESFTVGYRLTSASGTPFNFTNAERVGFADIPATTTNISSGNTLAARTVGTTSSGLLKVTQNVSFDTTSKFILTQVTLQNVSAQTLYKTRYMRSFDPDQDSDLNSNFTTNLSVLANPPTDQSAIVRANGGTTAAPVFFVGFDPRARASQFGFGNRDVYDSRAWDAPGVYGAGSTLLANGTNADSAITLTYETGDLAPGATATFFYFTSFDLNDTLVAFDDSNNLVISDVTGTASNDNLTVTRSGSNIIISDSTRKLSGGPGVTTLSQNSVSVPISSIAGKLIVNTQLGNDNLNINFTGGNPIPSGGISYNGGTGGNDSLVLTGGATTTITHAPMTKNDGSITLAGAIAGTITYAGLEPITDNVSAVNRIFDFTGAAESITVTDTGGADGVSTISSTLSESIAFTNPSASLEIKTTTTAGGDAILLTSFDAAYRAATTLTTKSTDNITVNSALTLGSATSTGNFTITAANAVTLGANISTDAGTNAGSISIAGPVTLGANLALDTDATGTDGAIAFTSGINATATDAQSLSMIAGGGNINVTTIGGSTRPSGLTVSSANNFTTTGGVTVGAGGVNVAATGTASFGGNLQSVGAGTITVNAATISITGTTTTSGAGNVSLTHTGVSSLVVPGNIVLGASATLTVNGTTAATTGSIAGVISGGGTTAVTKTGPGTLTLSGVNTYAGNTLVSGGIAVAGNGRAFGTFNAAVTKITVQSGATLDINGQGVGDFIYGVTIAGVGTSGQGALINNGASGNVNFQQNPNIKLAADAAIGGSGNIYMINAGYSADTLDLAGFTLTKTGSNTLVLVTTTVNAGTINIANGTVAQSTFGAASNASAANVTLANTAGATLDLGGFNLTIASLAGGGATGGNVALGANTLTVGNASSTTYAGVIGGIGGVTKTGSGTLTLSAVNTFTGVVNINQGILAAGNGRALGAFNSAVTKVNVASGGTVDINGQGIGDFIYGFTLAGTGSSGQGALINNGANGNNNFQQNPNIKLAADASIGGTGNIYMINAGYAADTLDLAGFTLTKTGSNTFFLVNTTVTAGTINIASGTFSQSNVGGNASAANVTLANTAGATLALGGFNLSIGSLAGGGATGGNVTLGANTLTVGNASSTTYAGAISGTGAVIKTGMGTLTLSGNSSYGGGTTLSQGTLEHASNTATGATTAPITIGDANTGANNTTLRFTAGLINNNLSTTYKPITVANVGGTTTFEFNQGGAFANINIATSKAITLTTTAGGSQFGMMGSISGNGAGAGNTSVTFANTGGATFYYTAGYSGSGVVANTFAGNVAINGNVNLQNLTYINAAYINGVIPDTASVTIGAGATWTQVWGGETLDGLNGTGGLNNGGLPMTVGASNGGGSFSGALSGGGSLTKNGTGVQTLSGGSINYTGATSVTNGTLILNQATAFNSATTVGAAILELAGAVNIDHPAGFSLALNNGSTLNKTNTGYDTFNSSNVTITGTVAMNITNNGTNNQLFIGGGGTGLTGTGTLNITNSGTTTTGLSVRNGINASHFNGPVNVSGGVLNIGSGGAALTFDNADVTLTGAILNLNGSFAQAASDASLKSLGGNAASSVVLGSQVLTLGTNNGTGANFAGGISGAGSLVKTGTGTQTISGGAKAFTGLSTINTGTLNFTDATTTGGITINSPGILELNRSVAGFGNRIGFSGTISGNGTVNVVSAANTAGASDGGWYYFRDTVSLTGQINVNSGVFGTDFTVANWTGTTAGVNVAANAVFTNRGNNIQIGALTGSGTVGPVWNGATTQVLTIGAGGGSGNFTGALRGIGGGTDGTINAGTLNITKIGGGTQTFSGAGLVNYTGATIVNGGTLELLDLGSAFNSNLTVNSPAILEIDSSIPFATRWNYSKTISGNGTLNKTSGGVFGITGAMSMSGQINVQAGRLHNDSVTGNWIANTANVDISAGAVLDLRANDMYVNQLTGAGEIWNSHNAGGGDVLFVGVAGGSSTYGGIIRGNASQANDNPDGAVLALTKNGGGTFTLTGNNTYSGATTVNAGTLLVNGANNGVGAVNVFNSAVLGGIGSIVGAVNTNNTSRLAPGASPETLATGSLTLTSGTFLDEEIGGTAPGNGVTGYDQLIVTGTVSLGNATLNLIQFGGFSVNNGVAQSYTIIDNDGTDAVTGTFLNLPEGSPITYAGGTVYVSYAGGIGNNDVVLYSQPTVNGGAGADALVLRQVAANPALVEFSLNAAPFVQVTSTLPFLFNGNLGTDLLLVDTSNGDPISTGNTTFNGELLRVQKNTGAASDTVTYVPSAVAGSGAVNHATFGTINFTGTTNVDFVNMTTVNVQTATVNDTLTIADGITATNGVAVPAGYSIAAAAELAVGGANAVVGLRNVTNSNIDPVTGGGNGNDSVTINSGTGAHLNTNLMINTSTGTDTVTIAGAITVGGNVDVLSQNIASNALLTAGAASTVTLNAGTGAITDGNGATNNVSGLNLALIATTGVGVGTTLETVVTNLEAQTATGGVFVANTGALSIGNVNLVQNGVDVTGASGDISLVATGSLSVILQDEDISGPGNITLNAQGTASDLTTSGFNSISTIRSSGVAALVSLSAGRDVNLGLPNPAGYGDTISAGSILITAGRDYVQRQDTYLDVNSAGTNTVNAGRDIILLNDGSNTRLSSQGGIITLTAGRNVTAGVLGSQVDTIDSTQGGAVPAGANIFITATTGNISLGDGVNAGTAGNVVLTAGGSITDTNINTTSRIRANFLTATAATGVGTSANLMEATINRLESSGGTGGVFVSNNAAALAIGGIGATVGVSATGGDIVVTTTGPLTVNENVTATGAGTDVTLNALDAVGAGQNLVLSAATTISSAAASVTLNAGDNATITGNISSGTITTINVDAGDAESAGPTATVGDGGTLTITGAITTPNTAAGGAYLNGGNDYDTFVFNPQTTTEFYVDGDLPVGGIVGDILQMNVTGTVNPNLTVPGSATVFNGKTYNGPGSGVWTFDPNHRNVRFKSIEDSQITGNYHLTYDNSVAPVGTLVVMLDGTASPNEKLQFRDTTTGGTVLYQTTLTPILSVRVLGGAAADVVTIDDVNGLPTFGGNVPGSTGVGDNPFTSDTGPTAPPEFFFDAGGGVNVLNFNLNLASTQQQYAFGTGAGPGTAEGEVQSANAVAGLNSYFRSVSEVNRTGTLGVTPGGLTVFGDNVANTISIDANGTESRVAATGYVPFDFSGNNYTALTVNALGGNDLVNLINFGSAQTNNPVITFNGNTEDDTIRVQSTRANTGPVNLNGNAGNDTFQLFSATNTVDAIAGPVVVDGTDGNIAANTDTLTIIDSGDLSGDNVLVSAVNPLANDQYAVEGTNTVAGNDVVFRNVDVLNYTGTSGVDTIDGRFVNTAPAHDLSMVSLSGWLGADQFLLFTSDQAGGSGLGFTPTATPSGVASVSLYGDAPGNPNVGDGNDIFGETHPGIVALGVMNVGLVVPDTYRLIRPSASTTIAIDGGQPTGLAAPLGDVVGDTHNLDISALPNTTPVVVSTFGPGTVVATGIAPITWTQIENINLVDQGKLTNVQMGDLFARTTPNADLVQITRNPVAGNPNQVRLRLTSTINNYSASNKTIIYAGGSNDNLTQSNLIIPAEFYGEDGDDYITGATNNDWLVGGTGNDRINGGLGDNILWGDNAPTTPGDLTPQDSAVGGDDILSGLTGADVFYGGAGNDQVSAGAGNDYAYGGLGNDSLDGNEGDDRLYGGAGNDLISGNGGNDLLIGGTNDDRIYGAEGNDILIGGVGRDLLDGGVGNDLLIGGNVANQDSIWTSLANTSTFSAATYSNPADNDLSLLALLAQWGSTSTRGLLGVVTHDGDNDDLWGGLGDDDFNWESIDLSDFPPGLAPTDYNAPGQGNDERFNPT